MTIKPWYSALILAGMIGCAGEQAPAPTPLPETPSSEIKPTPDAAKKDVPASAPKAEPAPDAAKKDIAPKAEPAPADAPKVEGPKAEAKPAKLTDEQIAEIKKLPSAEQDQALKQAVCPVSDEPLGEMGMPIKVTAEGKSFYLCCKSCEKEVAANPKAVLSKLTK